MHPYIWLLLLLVFGGCATTYVELEGECVLKRWMFAQVVMRSEVICLMPPGGDRRAVDVDQVDPYGDLNILEKLNRGADEQSDSDAIDHAD